MSSSITYFVHSATEHSLLGVRSGWEDVSLSDLGREQALRLGEETAALPFETVYCSDLRRATETVDIAFAGRTVTLDRRLREMNYGVLNGAAREQFPHDETWCIGNRFDGGECCHDVEQRMREFLSSVASAGRVAIVGHRYPQLALEVICNGYSWPQAIASDWRMHGQWQPGWTYQLGDPS